MILGPVAAVSPRPTIPARWAGLEFLILLLDVGKKVFAQLLCFYDHRLIRATILHVSRHRSIVIHGKTHVTCRNMSSSLSWPVDASM